MRRGKYKGVVELTGIGSIGVSDTHTPLLLNVVR